MRKLFPPFLRFTAAIAVGLELLLRATGLVQPLAPAASPGETRVAIFGESPMRGFGAPRYTEHILKHELERLYPGRKFHVRNFAELGMLFSGYQSNVLLWELAEYDAVLVYAGLNEQSLYAQRAGVFKAPGEAPDKPTAPPSRLRYAAGKWLESELRLYAAWTRTRSFVAARTAGLTPPFSLNRFQLGSAEFQPPLFPEAERLAIQDRYRESLRGIARAAASANKHVLVSEVLLHETYKPLASAFRPGLAPEGQDAVRRLYERGRSRAAAGDCAGALPSLKAALAVDDSPAIVHHLIGNCLLSRGRVDEARVELQRALELDLVPLRYVAPLNRIAREVAESEGGEHFRYIEQGAPFARLLRRGYTHGEFFGDFEHPTLLGHAFLTSNFLCGLSRLPGFAGPSENPCRDWAREDLRALAARYEKSLGVTDAERREAVFLIASWHFGMASMSAYPGDYFAASEAGLNRTLEMPGSDDRKRQDTLLLLGLIDLLHRGDPELARRRFESALALNPPRWRRLWLTPIHDGRNLEKICRPRGLAFDAVRLKFR